MSGLLDLHILYRLPVDGQPVSPDDLAAVLNRAGFACGRPEVAGRLDFLCEQGMALPVGQGRYARADHAVPAAGDGAPAGRPAQARLHDPLSMVVEGAGVGTWIWWLDTGHVEINETWASMLGYTRAELGRVTIDAWERLTHPDDVAKAWTLIGQYRNGELAYFDTLLRMRHKAGHWVLVQSRARLIQHDPAEGPVIVGVHHDVTEREQAYRELRLLSDVINSSPVVASRWRDEPGHPVEYISQTVSRFGYQAEDFTSGRTKFHDLIHPDDARCMREKRRDLIDETGRYRLVYRLRHKAGRWLWVEEIGWQGQDSDSTEINCVLLDITRSKRLEQKLKLYATLIDNSADVIVLIGPDLRYRIANQGYLNIVGKSLDKVLGRSKAEIFGQTLPAEYHEAFEHNLQRALTLGPGESMVIEERVPDIRGGPERTFRSRYFPVFDALTEEFQGIALLSVEITDLKRAQAALMHSEQRFRSLFEKLPAAIIIHDAETGKVLDVNNWVLGFYQVETLAQLQAIGDIWNHPPPYSREDALGWIRKTMREGGQRTEWHSLIHGRSVWTSIALEPIEYEGAPAVLMVSVDITEKVLAQQALAQSEARFRGLVEHLPNVAVQGYGEDKRITLWNKGSELIYGYTASEAIGQDLTELVIPSEQRAAFSRELERWLAEGTRSTPMEVSVWDKHGARKCVLSSRSIQRSPAGGLEFYCVDVDLTVQKRVQERLEVLALAFSHSYDGVVIMDSKAVAVEVNDRYCEITGFGRDELLGRKPSMLRSEQHDDAFYDAMWTQLDAQGYWVGEVWNRRKSGDRYPIEISITVLTGSDGAVANYIANVTDITERLDYEAKLRHVALYDPLTGLPNRSSVSETLRQAIARFKYRDVPFAVVFIDLDEFKAINDGHGHEVGDLYLQRVARRLQSILREGDVAARFGGDEFVLILQNQTPAAPACPVFDRLLTALHDPVLLDGKVLRLTASFGVTFYPQDSAVDADQLLRQADQAMYSAKQMGKNQIVYFDAEFERAIVLRNARIAEFRRAIEHGELTLHYQPQVDMASGRVLGVEALMRWRHPTAGPLHPDAFLDLIQEHEQLGLTLNKWVLARSLDDLSRLRARGHDLSLSVNTVIPTADTLRADFLSDLGDILRQHADTPPDRVTLEVVENVLIDDLTEAARTVNQLQQLGVQISLDDFGTGFSSLSYLKHLSFDELKIDQKFVRNMLNDRDDMTIVQAVVSLSQSFDVAVIGEGVETMQHAEMLLRLGCVRAQGYAISRPLDVDALEAWLDGWRPDPAWKTITPISPYFYQAVANLSGYAGWIADLEQYLRGQAGEAPDWSFQTCGLAAQLRSNAGMKGLWDEMQERERIMHAAGIAAIAAFQKSGPTAESERQLDCAAQALRELQALVWSRLTGAA